MLHNHDCKVFQLEDLLKDMLRHEENIENYDARKEFGVMVDTLIECIGCVNDEIERHEDEARYCRDMYDSEEDRNYYLNEQNEDLKEKIKAFEEAYKGMID